MLRRRSLAVMAVLGSLVAGYVVVEMGPRLAGQPSVAQAAPLPGFGNISGSVQAATPFKAAQVFIRNVDKRVLFMVYTSAGQFRATPLFPGNYEISASDRRPPVRRTEARRQGRRQPEGVAVAARRGRLLAAHDRRRARG